MESGNAQDERRKNLSRGAISREEFALLVAEGLTVRAIAARVDRSPGTVRHWLGRYGLKTAGSRGRRATPGHGSPARTCAVHGEVAFVVRSDGFESCVRCRAEAVTRRRRRVKRLLIDEAGGACALCGYDACQAALQFHHVDPSTKRFGLGARGLALGIDRLRLEVQKCALLCANCHAEVESGYKDLPARMSPSRVNPHG